MREFRPDEIQILTCDIFGTTVDWHSGVTQQVAAILGDDVDAVRFASQWRDRYLPSMARVRKGEKKKGRAPFFKGALSVFEASSPRLNPAADLASSPALGS